VRANLLALLLGCISAVLCSEVVLRLTSPAVLADQLYHDYDPDVGWLLRPIHGGRTSRSCLDITDIQVNSLGFRDKEWSGRYTIGVLGDSFMQGSQLPEGTLVPQILDSLLGMPVMNAGIDGFGTLHEYLVYKKYVLQHRPEVVLLFFYPVNDVADNIGHLWNGTARPMPRAIMDKDGNVSVVRPTVTRESDGLRTFVKRHLKTALLFRRVYDYTQAMRLEGHSTDTSGVYLPEDDTWREAWKITEHYLVQLKQDIEGHGGKFFLVPIPEYIQLAPDWEQDFKAYYHLATMPEGFSRERPIKTIERIAEAHGLRVIQLSQFFHEYRDRFKLPAPYFYYRCDGHWNPIGHFLAANVIAKFLIERGFIHGDIVRIERNLRLSPIEILSPDGYQQIYGDRRFTGKTNITKLLEDH
jgi:hypothetical protein